MTAIAAPEAPATIIYNRKATTDFTLGTDARGREVVASVVSYHSKDNKALVAYVSRVSIEQSGSTGFVIRSSAPMDAVRVMNTPIGRYSDKALESFNAEAVELVKRFRDAAGNERINAVFATVG